MTERMTPDEDRKAELARKIAPLLLQLVEEHRQRQHDTKDAA